MQCQYALLDGVDAIENTPMQQDETLWQMLTCRVPSGPAVVDEGHVRAAVASPSWTIMVQHQ